MNDDRLEGGYDVNVALTVNGEVRALDVAPNTLLVELLHDGARVVEVEPERETLEDLFVRKAMASGE